MLGNGSAAGFVGSPKAAGVKPAHADPSAAATPSAGTSKSSSAGQGRSKS
jgi:hypothetical protein